ncbi:MAG: glycosyltransferase [Desulfocapsaceae bacterium]|nr:glycosyltransferase [Desulfocapsaceae bacterium]
MGDNKKSIIVVLGMHRSGTSVMTRGLQALGVNLGDSFLPSKEDNQKGFWEDIDLNTINIEMLSAVNSDWHHLAPIESIDVELLQKKGYFFRAVDLLRLKVDKVPLFAFKDPRVAKLLLFWKEVFNYCQFDVSYVIAVRHPLSVAKSLAKRNSFDAEKSHLLWLGYVVASLSGTVGERRVFVDYDRLMQSPDRELNRIAQCLDLEIDLTELQNYKTEILDQSLRHAVNDLNDLVLDDACPLIVREIYTALLNVASDKISSDDVGLQNKIAQWSDEFDRLKSPFVLIDRLFTATESLVERDGQVVRLNQDVVDRDGQIVLLNQVLAGRDRQLSNCQQIVVQRDGQIAILKKNQQEQEKKINQMHRAVTHNVFTKLGCSLFKLNLRKWAECQLLKREIKALPLFDAAWYSSQYLDVKMSGMHPLHHYCYLGVEEGRNPNPYFDTQWYLSEYPDVAYSGINPLYHYLKHGVEEGRNPNPYFDTQWYLKEYPDVARSGMNPLLHYLQHGAANGNNPGPYFDTQWYLSEYKDVAQSGMNPLLHYLKHGVDEKKNTNPCFDTQWYLSEYPEVALSGVNPLLHYLKYGVNEGKNPSPYFDTQWYWSEYPDVVRRGVNPLFHYLKYGIKEGNNPSPYFFSQWYLSEYPDVVRRNMSPLLHYLKYGVAEGRSPNPYFDTQWYLSEYPDVALSGMDPLLHYLKHGAEEGRKPNPYFDVQWYLSEYPDVVCGGINPLLHYLKHGAEGGRVSSAPIIPGYERARNGELSSAPIMSFTASRSELLHFDLVLVTYNSSRWIDNCMTSLLPHDKNITITIVDNASTDDTIARLELYQRKFSSFKIVKNEFNLGFGAANNLGAKARTGNYLFFLNIDTELHDTEAFSKLSNIITLSNNDVVAWELRQLPYEHPKCYDPVSLETSWFSGAAVVVKRDAFEELQGFDEKLFMYCEDVDLSWRLRANGYRLLYCPSVTITHHSYSKPGEVKPIAQLYGVKHNYFLRNRYGNEQDIKIGKDLLVRFARYAKENLSSTECEELTTTEKESAYFRETRCESNDFFEPFFDGYNYEIAREGGFFVSKVSPQFTKVSVIVRTIGRLDYLERAIYSIVNQTYRNIEIVIVEDGSSIAEDIVSKFKDFNIVYKSTEKVGRCRAGNIGLEMATGDFFNFLDEDDLLYCDHIETLVNAISDKPYCGAVWSSAFCVSTEETEKKEHYYERHYTLGHTEEPDNDSIMRINFFPIQAVLFRRECYEKLGGFDPEMDLLEDWDLWVRYFKQYKFSRIAKTTSLYRVPFNKTISKKREQRMKQYHKRVQVKNR